MLGKKKIYILLSYTGTILSRIIRLYTGDKYCHASLSLDRELNELYSFGRLNPYNPFIGGFVKEGINIGTFKRFKNTKCAVYSIEVTSIQYNKIKSKLNDFKSNPEKYHFNVLGLFLSAFHIKVQREDYFYCSEFVKYLIEYADIDIKLPDVVRPIYFNNHKMYLEYSGYLKNYLSTIDSN